MEWDTVVLLDPFPTLTALGPPGSHPPPWRDPPAPALAGWGGGEVAWEWGGFDKDDVNLWYVAATRARRRLELPAQWIALESKIQARSRPGPARELLHRFRRKHRHARQCTRHSGAPAPGRRPGAALPPTHQRPLLPPPPAAPDPPVRPVP
jgi:hypothetical protein